jgi:two-component system response regulator BaeR
MNGTILIVEDERKLAELLSDYLKQAGFSVHILDDGREAAPWVRLNAPDLVLLDLMLPGRDGMDVCRDLRGFSHVPIVMVTARVEEIDRLLGLELGADDYICKPFSPREVVARVKAVLRRTVGDHDAVAAGLELDSGRLRATLNGQDLGLTAVEFKLLAFLGRHPGRIYSREQLMDHIYPDERIVSDRTIDSHIKKLRKKIAVAEPSQELIRSVYGAGYAFDPQ